MLASLSDSGSSPSPSDSEALLPAEPSADLLYDLVADPECDCALEPEPLLEPEGDHDPLQDVCEPDLEPKLVLELDPLVDAQEPD